MKLNLNKKVTSIAVLILVSVLSIMNPSARLAEKRSAELLQVLPDEAHFLVEDYELDSTVISIMRFILLGKTDDNADVLKFVDIEKENFQELIRDETFKELLPKGARSEIDKRLLLEERSRKRANPQD